MKELYQLKTNPIADPKAVIQGEHYRFTVLTSQLIRMEYSEEGVFEDRPTQRVLNRDFDVPEFQVKESERELEILTEHLHLFYQKGAFTRNSLKIEVLGNISTYHSTWHFGEEPRDLKGTARTLDHADGPIPLEKGLLSKFGYSTMDDSQSVLLKEDGWVEPRKNQLDLYFFGYGRDYLQCLKDFYYLSGPSPLLPRYVLGNWWSRYHKYDEQEYKELMERFEREGLPFSVAIIDMDWHLVDIDPKYGSGWTGYTWNRDLFPDPKAFMDWLHQRGMKVSLNLHPAQGVMPHEEMYEDMAKALGVNYQNEEAIPFDFTDPAFVEAYFKYLHHPHEEQGVDFWWIDWQSGDISKIEGLDPMWMLNHYHFLDSKRRGKRPLTFSRYVGMGSHRYPIGFSGDTHVSWASLEFQPYFTATASNVGYGWWSHDIGGHYWGYRDEELAVRWVQFGVFSPINRIHGHVNPFIRKEPWFYGLEAEKTMGQFLRLRHRLVPYLYTMNVLNHKEGLPLIQPMYYQHPWDKEAYDVNNQYYYGSELIVAPVTSKTDPKTRKGKVKAWLPKGQWFDVFNGRVYEGDREMNLYRGMDTIPVLAKAGAILPLNQETKNETDNPIKMEVQVFAGADGSFTLLEDDGESSEETHPGFASTRMNFQWKPEDQQAEFHIARPEGTEDSLKTLPFNRTHRVVFRGLANGAEATVSINGEEITAATAFKKKGLTVDLPPLDHESEVTITVKQATVKENDYITELYEFLMQASITHGMKEKIYLTVQKTKNQATVLSDLQAMDIDKNVLEAISEILWAK